MLDLVQQEIERLDSRFLEPACGDGNFLVEVLNRKLKILVNQFKKNQYEFEKNSIVVIGSIYGIDILEDNLVIAKHRLLEKFFETYKKIFSQNINQDFISSVEFILEQNIIHGDALSLKKVDSEELVTFSEWVLVDNKIRRRDFTFKHLLDGSPFENEPLFHDREDAFIPSPTKEYPLVNFTRVFEAC